MNPSVCGDPFVAHTWVVNASPRTASASTRVPLFYSKSSHDSRTQASMHQLTPSYAVQGCPTLPAPRHCRYHLLGPLLAGGDESCWHPRAHSPALARLPSAHLRWLKSTPMIVRPFARLSLRYKTRTNSRPFARMILAIDPSRDAHRWTSPGQSISSTRTWSPPRRTIMTRTPLPTSWWPRPPSSMSTPRGRGTGARQGHARKSAIASLATIGSSRTTSTQPIRSFGVFQSW
jgi:hypothetical protein